MATEFISNSWLMPENSNQDKLANYSLSFDGSSQYIQIPYSANLTPQTGNFSISAWINSDNLSGWHPIWSTLNLASSGKNVALHTFDDKVRATVGGSTDNPSYGGSWALILDSTQSLTTSTWFHIVVTYNMSGNAQIYINGNADNSGPIENPQTSWNTGDRYIGEGEGFWDGKITELAIFDYALSASQVTQLYGSGSAVGNPMSLSTKPVAYYPLGQSAFNGEFLATNKATELFENYALDFDGSNDYIDCGTNSSLDITGNITLSGWINRDDNLNSSNIIAKWNSGPTDTAYILRVTSSGGAASNSQIEMLIRNDSGTVVTAIENVGEVSINKWVHVLGTYDGSNIRVYYNGVELGSGTSQTGNIETSSASLKIGSRGTEYTEGKLSNISIYNSALSAEQVTTLYNNGKPSDLSTFAVTPVSWWRLGAVNSSFDGTNWTVLDEIGTNNGTSANMTQADLVDGVGATGNGVSSGMSSGTNKVGNSPYSENNAVSYNMSVTAKSTSVPT